MRRAVRVAVFAAVFAVFVFAGAASCSSNEPQTSSPPPSTSRTVSLGSGIVATLTQSGQLTITQGGKTVVSTAPGQALFTASTDTANFSGYHNPEELTGVAFEPVPNDGITMESPEAGVLHLVATNTKTDTVMVSVALASDDGFYTGLGERYDHVDPRGQIVGMQLELDLSRESGTTDVHVPVPWLVSSRGYGVFVEDRDIGAWDVASADPGVVRSTFDGAALDVMIVVNRDPIAVVAKLDSLAGLPRKTPLWALGPMMWQHVDSQVEVTNSLTMIRSLHVPTTTFWIDDGWQTGLNSFTFDPTQYTSVTSLGQTLGSMGFKWFLWSSPYIIAPGSGVPTALEDLYATALKDDDFVRYATGKLFVAPGPGSGTFGMIDFTSASATSLWTGLAKGPVAFGMDGYKLDYGEDLIPDLLGAPLGIKLADGETERTARDYPLDYHKAYRDSLTGTDDGGVLFVRASTYGGASVCDIVWPGDLDNGFQTDGSVGSGGEFNVGGLPASVVAAQTLAVSGFPLYGADTGGYRGGAPTEEALLRWAEHTSLSMVMQLGPGEDKYPWNYDAGTVTTYTALANLHQAIVPYLTALLLDAETTGTPTIRPLPLQYPEDADAASFADTEYLLGPSLLVAPVVTEGATSRSVHVPPGDWMSWWDSSVVTGPKTLSVAAPIGTPPLYVLAGTLLPMFPAGIDTLVSASEAGTVSLDAKAGLDTATAWVRGPASASFWDGSQVSVTDTSTGITVTWTPRGTGRVLTLTMDLGLRSGKSGALTTVKATSGSSPVEEASEAAVLAAKASAYHLSGNQAVLRLDGASVVTIE
jgi:alpha-glucosidase (family GH31 glycosyl hydrolase)